MAFLAFVAVLLANLLTLGQCALPKPVIGAYFPNWAQYRPQPATYTPDQMKPIISTLNVVWYGFAYFCPNSSMVQPYWVTQLNLCQGKQPFDVISIEPKDPQFYQEIVAMKKTNRNLKVVLSIGGWNFPSNFWSGMVSDSASRSHFIQSCLSFMNQYGFDGIDVDWEFPNSPPRVDEVKISNDKFDQTIDEGGSPQDGPNLIQLLKEMRQAFGAEKVITLASQADMLKANMEHVADLAPYLDAFNLMSYDYTVSDINDSTLTAPNEPLIAPNIPGILNDSVKTTIDGYLALGIDPSKMNVGVSYYGHTWYVPGLDTSNQASWCKFGLKAQVQGQCAGPFVNTYGAKYGKYSELCGTYMYSEIEAAGFTTCFENKTMSNIGYAVNPTDGYTAKGVFIAYQGEETIEAIINYQKDKRLRGAFAFDISMDSMSGSQFTYTLTKKIAELEKTP